MSLISIFFLVGFFLIEIYTFHDSHTRGTYYCISLSNQYWLFWILEAFCQVMYMLEFRISFDRYSAICFFEKNQLYFRIEKFTNIKLLTILILQVPRPPQCGSPCHFDQPMALSISQVEPCIVGYATRLGHMGIHVTQDALVLGSRAMMLFC